jgi:hypothetical protein
MSLVSLKINHKFVKANCTTPNKQRQDTQLNKKVKKEHKRGRENTKNAKREREKARKGEKKKEKI